MSEERKAWTCPACGVGCAPHVDFCGNCALKALMKPIDEAMEQAKKDPPAPVEPFPAPWQPEPWLPPWYPYTPTVPSRTITVAGTSSSPPCMFDNLPPGVYQIACPCPKHATMCAVSFTVEGSVTASDFSDALPTVMHGQKIGGTQHYS